MRTLRNGACCRLRGIPLLRRGEGVPPACRGDFPSPQPDRGEVWPGVFVTDAGMGIQTESSANLARLGRSSAKRSNLNRAF